MSNDDEMAIADRRTLGHGGVLLQKVGLIRLADINLCRLFLDDLMDLGGPVLRQGEGLCRKNGYAFGHIKGNFSMIHRSAAQMDLISDHFLWKITVRRRFQA